jgi:HK97 family phage portal protein
MIFKLGQLAKKSLTAWVGRKIGLTDDKFWSTFFGTDTWSGETVNVDTAMQVSAFWACVKLLSQTIGSLPIGLFRKLTDGSREEAKDHPLYPILHDQPNADKTSVEFWEAMVACLCIDGNAYAEKLFGTGNTLIGLSFLRPDRTKVDRNSSGALVYTYTGDPGGKERKLSEDRVFHVRAFGTGGDLGLSPLAYARQTIGSSRAIERASATMFANGMRPSGWLVYKGGILKEQQRKQVREAIIAPISGTENQGKIGILEADFDYRQMTISPEDSQMLESRGFSVEEVCRWLGVPPILVGHSAAGQTMWGSGIEQIIIGWLTLGLRPYLTRIEQAVKRSLIPVAERRLLYAEFSVEGLLRADSAGRAALYSSFAQNGVMTRNEIRAKENLPRQEGGDVLTVQANLVPLDKLADGTAGNTAAGVRAALQSWLHEEPEPKHSNLRVVK